MAERTQLISAKSQQGHSLSQISDLTELTIVKETQTTKLTPYDGFIFAFETHALANRSSPTTTEESKEPDKPHPTETLPRPQHSPIPAFFYCCLKNSNELHRVNLLTGEQSCHNVPNYEFNPGCRWSELPGGSLLITGGYFTTDVVKINALREFAVSSQPPMHTARGEHAAVYHSQHLYVLGYEECERYVCAESRWEVMPALPKAGFSMSAVELDSSLYALGGNADSALDTVQKLSLSSLTWQLMQLKLPLAAYWMPCFKTDTQVYLVIKETLYSFTPLEVKPVKSLAEFIICNSSYYSRGTLYYELGLSIERLSIERWL
jgi:hypothetical protein